MRATIFQPGVRQQIRDLFPQLLKLLLRLPNNSVTVGRRMNLCVIVDHFRPADVIFLSNSRAVLCNLLDHRRQLAKPLGRVIQGFGNNGDDGLEGVRRDNLFGTYLHGPLLPKNAWLADHLVAVALGRRHGEIPQLEPLEDELELAAAESARAAAMRN